MHARFNGPAAAALVFCLVVWMAAGVSAAKLGDIYQHRGPSGFRHALMARLEHHLRRADPRSVEAFPGDSGPTDRALG